MKFHYAGWDSRDGNDAVNVVQLSHKWSRKQNCGRALRGTRAGGSTLNRSTIEEAVILFTGEHASDKNV
jgi:hypothetical protein